MFSLNIVRTDCPEPLQRAVYVYANTKVTSSFLHEMNTCELGKFALAYGFLASKFFLHADHTRTVHFIAQEAVNRKHSDTITTRNLVKCLSLSRVPLDDTVTRFFKWVDTGGMSVDEKVFVLRAGIDNGIINHELLITLLETPIEIRLRKSSSASLLFCMAIAGCRTDDGVVHRLLNNCDLDPADPRSLVVFWSAHIIQADLSSFRHLLDKVIERGLKSSDPRDQTMAESIAYHESRDALTIAQSSKHLKHREYLVKKYGPLIPEYEIVPGLTVDEACIDNKIAIELDGPTHFLVNLRTGEKQLNGPTLFKEERIRRSGWGLIRFDLVVGEEKRRF